MDEKFKNSYGELWITGIHPVQAAIDNPERKKICLYLTKEAEKKISIQEGKFTIKYTTRSNLDKILENKYNHQGIALKVKQLKNLSLEEFISLKKNPPTTVIILDKLTDPQNIGAIIRTAAAFSASAIICTERNSPKENSFIAKSSAGAIEKIKLIYVKNIAKSIIKLKKNGYWSIAMDNESDFSLNEVAQSQNLLNDNIAIIVGNEGKGIRPLVKKNCDTIAKIAISKEINSLNVSVSLAIALYEIRRK